MQTAKVVRNWIRKNLAGLLVGAVLGYCLNVLVAFQFQSTPQLVCEVLSLDPVQLDDHAETKLLDKKFLEILQHDTYSLSSLQLQVSNCGSGGIREADYSSDDPLHVGIVRGMVASQPKFFGLNESRFSEGPAPRVSYLTAIAFTREGDRQPEDDSAALREHFRDNHSIRPDTAKALVRIVDEGVMRLDGIYSEPIWKIDLPAASLNPGDSYVVECWVVHKDTPVVRFSGSVVDTEVDTEIVSAERLQIE